VFQNVTRIVFSTIDLEARSTKDIVHVHRILDYKSNASTLKYIQLIDIPSDEWLCKAVTTPEEAVQEEEVSSSVFFPDASW
jgi:hypothetical protein